VTDAEEAKKRRDRAREEGRCQQCCKRPAIPGRSRCEECYARYVARSPQDAENKKKQREQAVANGLCYTCCKRPVKEGCRNCEHCIRATWRRDDRWCDECLAFGFHRVGCIVLSHESRRAA
jgi:hypothetical protein